VTPAQCGAALAALALCTGPAFACELVLVEHRAAREVLRLPFVPSSRFTVAFEHSVLGSTVTDTYRLNADGRALLVEERFRGEGYGLPHAAGPGERLERDGEGWRLVLDRAVAPLVVRPLPQQRMRIVLAGRELVLASLGARAVEIAALGCAVKDPA
jgi:hypothetical protein